MSLYFRELASGIRKISIALGAIGLLVFGVWLYNMVGKAFGNPDVAIELLPDILVKGVFFILNNAVEALVIGLLIAGLLYLANQFRSLGY